jgi:ATP-binding cassette, subfamily B, bacterial
VRFLDVWRSNCNIALNNQMEQIWKQRAEALREIPRFLLLVWEASPQGVVGTVALRLIGGLAPVAMLYVAKRVVDLISAAAQGKPTDDALWFWIGLEFGLSAFSQVIAKGIDFLDAMVADRFNYALASRIMRHAATLDLASFEDATFQDRLERARAQTTDRTGMLTSMGSLIQRLVMLLSLAGGILVYSPWVLITLILSTVPVFWLESHFAFLSYRQAHEQTPVRRLLDYYLALGSSAESAKEVKVFSLAPYLDEKYQSLSQDIIKQRRRLWKLRIRGLGGI